MSKIYTRTGDEGDTSLLGGRRVKKDDARMEAIGSLDELNAAIGVARAHFARGNKSVEQLDAELAEVQHRLFELGAELAAVALDRARSALISDSDVSDLEAAIDRHDASLAPLRAFILPGGLPAAAQLHFARSVARRCERRLVALAARDPLRSEVLRYINRLGDWLFVAARAANHAGSVPDVHWEQRS
jgi:cob(I)alamin adenosyltransferase